MQKLILSFLVCFITTQTLGQTPKIVTIYLSAQYNKTIADRTIGNNPWGAGLGVQSYFNIGSKFKPTIELTGDLYLMNDKVYRTNPDGTPINEVGGMVNLFAGSSYQPTKNIYVSLVAGPSFINGRTLLGIKPSFGVYFPKNKRWTAKISFINIFNRDKTSKNDFSSVSLAIGRKLF
jgi:hypothetical protein